MSGSPKYTDVYYDAQRQAELAAAARLREAERQRRIEQERQKRVAAEAAGLSRRMGELSSRVGGLAEQAGRLSQAEDVRRLFADVGAMATRAQTARDDDAIRRGRKDLREAQRRLDALATAVARELLTTERRQAIDMVLGQLGTLGDRESLDRQGAQGVAALAEGARARVTAAKGFPEEFKRLETAVLEHAQRVRDQQATLAGAADALDSAQARLAAAGEQARSAGVMAVAVQQVEGQLASARADIDALRVAQATQSSATVVAEVDRLALAVEAELARLDRLNIVVKAATAALPRAGLRVVGGTLQLDADNGVTFRAERQDGTPVMVTVQAGAESTTLEYRTHGDDFVVHQLPDGELRECDVTEDLLKRVGEELAKEHLSTGEVQWKGKGKSTTPRSSQALQLPGEQSRQAGKP